MRTRTLAIVTVALAGGALVSTLFVSRPAAQQPAAPASLERDYPVAPVPFTAVHLTDTFWLPKIETNRAVTIPVAFEQCEITGRIDNFIRAAAALRGETLTNTRAPGYPFDDTDPYKVIEGASYTLSVHPDPKLSAYVDDLIAKIAAAQEKDGYLYTTRAINPQSPHPWAGKERWVLEKVDSHELYNFGHLTEAAVAHFQATGKRTLLDVAIRFADLLVNTFGPGKQAIWPGHQVAEMALVKLYRATGNGQYLDLSKFLLDVRKPDAPATSNHPATYNQSMLPVIEQTEAVGHAVRATYMYSGMADVAALTGDKAYLKALEAIWGSIVLKKLYITGGIGASGSGEAFGKPYELPNITAYNETCASVGNDFWNERMFLLTGDAKYVDVMERTLYNGLISGVSLDGKTFFYTNRLESKGQDRQAWFGVACCPSNISRFLPSIPGYVYAKQAQAVFVNLFIAGSADIALGDGRSVSLTQQTKYPWEGGVTLTMTSAPAGTLNLKIRIPGWARNEPVPGDLYRFLEPSPARATIRLNGAAVPFTMDKGYATISRVWRAGDVVDLSLPMAVRRIVANDLVDADKGRVAIQRGPIVFAAEWVDNGGQARNLALADTVALTTEFRPAMLGGVQVVKGTATALSRNEAGQVVRKTQPFLAIPYYAWANRGFGEMTVWLPRTDAAATPSPFPTLAMSSKVTTSLKAHLSEHMVNDGEEPVRSSLAGSSFDWWPDKGRTEFLQYDFPKATSVSETQVYWFDDTGRGGVRVPASWRLLYKDGKDWKPVAAKGDYGLDLNKYNVVAFAPVTTTAVRLEIVMKEFPAGVIEWKVR